MVIDTLYIKLYSPKGRTHIYGTQYEKVKNKQSRTHTHTPTPTQTYKHVASIKA